MKQLVIGLTLIAFAVSGIGQAPQVFNYQAILRNLDGSVKANETVEVQINILQTDGTVVYFEIHKIKTSSTGLINLQIGRGITSDDFSEIDWSSGRIYMTVHVNGTYLGTNQFLSVPYALHSNTADSLIKRITEADPVYSSSVASGITGTDTATWNSKLGSYTETDPLYAVSVASGITGSDTATWNSKLESYTETDPLYILSVASGISASDTTNWNNKLDDDGEQDPVYGASVASEITALDITNWNSKLDSYTETQTFANVLVQNNDGDSLQIKNIGDPTDPQDAVTKAYVDDLKKVLYQVLDLGDLISAGASISDLLASGYSVTELSDAGVDISTLLEHGISVSVLLEAGASVLELFEAGVMVGTLEQNGADPDSLEAAGLIGSLSDIDGNTYKWVRIGDQVWMAENLKVTRYSDGTAMQLVESGGAWNGNYKQVRWYGKSTVNRDTYGGLYNLTAVLNGAAPSFSNPSGVQGVCPAGWHVPSSAEWSQLKNYLGGDEVAGGKMKETGTSHWNEPNRGATNESGFTALPGGGDFMYGRIGEGACFWTPTEICDCYTGYRKVFYFLGSSGGFLGFSSSPGPSSGMSVRCVKD